MNTQKQASANKKSKKVGKNEDAFQISFNITVNENGKRIGTSMPINTKPQKIPRRDIGAWGQKTQLPKPQESYNTQTKIPQNQNFNFTNQITSSQIRNEESFDQPIAPILIQNIIPPPISQQDEYKLSSGTETSSREINENTSAGTVLVPSIGKISKRRKSILRQNTSRDISSIHQQEDNVAEILEYNQPRTTDTPSKTTETQTIPSSFKFPSKESFEHTPQKHDTSVKNTSQKSVTFSTPINRQMKMQENQKKDGQPIEQITSRNDSTKAATANAYPNQTTRVDKLISSLISPVEKDIQQPQLNTISEAEVRCRIGSPITSPPDDNNQILSQQQMKLLEQGGQQLQSNAKEKELESYAAYFPELNLGQPLIQTSSAITAQDNTNNQIYSQNTLRLPNPSSQQQSDSDTNLQLENKDQKSEDSFFSCSSVSSEQMAKARAEIENLARRRQQNQPILPEPLSPAKEKDTITPEGVAKNIRQRDQTTTLPQITSPRQKIQSPKYTIRDQLRSKKQPSLEKQRAQECGSGQQNQATVQSPEDHMRSQRLAKLAKLSIPQSKTDVVLRTTEKTEDRTFTTESFPTSHKLENYSSDEVVSFDMEWTGMIYRGLLKVPLMMQFFQNQIISFVGTSVADQFYFERRNKTFNVFFKYKTAVTPAQKNEFIQMVKHKVTFILHNSFEKFEVRPRYCSITEQIYKIVPSRTFCNEIMSRNDIYMDFFVEDSNENANFCGKLGRYDELLNRSHINYIIDNVDMKILQLSSKWNQLYDRYCNAHKYDSSKDTTVNTIFTDQVNKQMKISGSLFDVVYFALYTISFLKLTMVGTYRLSAKSLKNIKNLNNELRKYEAYADATDKDTLTLKATNRNFNEALNTFNMFCGDPDIFGPNLDSSSLTSYDFS